MTEVTERPGTAPADLAGMLTSRRYHALLFVAGLVGIPVALVAFGFLVLVTELQNWVWVSLPDDFGWDKPTAWFAVVVLTAAGVLVGLIVTRLPGRGGHLPVKGLGGETTKPIELPGMLLAALASLVLGTVLGPEGPLTGLGAGLVLLGINRTRLAQSPQAVRLLALAGSAAAVATVFGNPLVAAVLMLELVGVAGTQVLVVRRPCMVSAGASALIFVGLGHWTGIDVPSLTIPGLPAASLDVQDILWAVPIAVLAAVGAQGARRLGQRAAEVTSRRAVATTAAAGLLVGTCAAAYTLATGRSVVDVLQSGEAALPHLVRSPASWSIATLLLLLVCKGVAYGLSLGSFRGGPTFPAVFLGAALGVLLGPLPGLGTTAGIGIGMTATTTAVLRLPVTSVVLVVLLLGTQGASEMPVIMLTAAVALVTAAVIDQRADAATVTGRPDQSAQPR